MTSKLCRGRALLAALPLLWLHAGVAAGHGAAIDSRESSEQQIERTVTELLGTSIEVDFLANRLLDIDLGGPKPAALVADVITRLALDDVETDDVLLLSLRFRNGNLGGALELRDLSLPFALEFGEAESDSTSSDDLTFEGLIFENMTFEKKVVFSNVSWSDEVFIDRSTFEQGLSIKYSTLTSPDDKDPRKILINKSFIEHDFHLLHLTVKGKLLLYDNTISPAFQIEDSSMRHGTILRDNDFADFMIHGGTNYSITGINLNNVDRFELKNSWFAEIQIGQNNISSELVIDDVTWDREFELTANTIGEEFYFKPKHVGYSAKNGSVINLVANSVGGVASIAIPANDLNRARFMWTSRALASKVG